VRRTNRRRPGNSSVLKALGRIRARKQNRVDHRFARSLHERGCSSGGSESEEKELIESENEEEISGEFDDFICDDDEIDFYSESESECDGRSSSEVDMDDHDDDELDLNESLAIVRKQMATLDLDHSNITTPSSASASSASSSATGASSSSFLNKSLQTLEDEGSLAPAVPLKRYCSASSAPLINLSDDEDLDLEVPHDDFKVGIRVICVME
jgi:hypothetical protein